MNGRLRRARRFTALAMAGVTVTLLALPAGRDHYLGWIACASAVLLVDAARLAWRHHWAWMLQDAAMLFLLWMLPLMVVCTSTAMLLWRLRDEAMTQPLDGRPRVAWRAVDNDDECGMVYVHDDAGEALQPFANRSSPWKQRAASAPLQGVTWPMRPIFGSFHETGMCR